MAVEAQIQELVTLLQTVLPTLGLFAILLAGGLYAFGTMAGSHELNARMKSWAQRVGIGGAMAVIIGNVAPTLVSWLTGI
ncbi:MAG: hypothetical protein Q8P02_00765 [Candidatus Micrarchaeota archaeon]|nr:hypothetical protein [Candidatus Micrarchaeota archaeon]